MDLTNKVIDNVLLENGVNYIEFNINELVLFGEIIITDDREYSDPNYDSTDGMPEYIGGECTIEIDLGLTDEKGRLYEFEIKEDDLLTFYKNI